ncbi:MAG TPA: hypothetical protein VLS95_00595 [Arthrobacter sp.]|nr:hypothetical protein [Arthrobacter sp.]
MAPGFFGADIAQLRTLSSRRYDGDAEPSVANSQAVGDGSAVLAVLAVPA